VVELAVNEARDEILARVRRALAGVPDAESPEDVPVPRGYLEREPGGPDAVLDRFVERVADYGAGVRVVRAAGLAEAVAAACREHGVGRLVVPDGVPAGWLPGGVEAVRDTALSAEALDAVDGVLTGCALAIAETGTLVLDAGPRQGRRALTLVPDVHVCVVDRDQVVDGVPAALRLLSPGLRTTRRPLTFVSGPSATSDIELSRVEGVHGPRRLEVIVIGAV
jgi:L-lactate dehydrogenase complex protein LldG